MVEGFDWTEHDSIWNNLFPHFQTLGSASVISLISKFSNWKSALFFFLSIPQCYSKNNFEIICPVRGSFTWRYSRPFLATLALMQRSGRQQINTDPLIHISITKSTQHRDFKAYKAAQRDKSIWPNSILVISLGIIFSITFFSMEGHSSYTSLMKFLSVKENEWSWCSHQCTTWF